MAEAPGVKATMLARASKTEPLANSSTYIRVF